MLKVNFSYQDVKKALYLVQTLLGINLIIVSTYLLTTTNAAIHQICQIVPAVISMIAGIACVFFGIETYMLRDDPDIWR